MYSNTTLKENECIIRIPMRYFFLSMFELIVAFELETGFSNSHQYNPYYVYPYCSLYRMWCCWPKYFVIAYILLLPKSSLGSCWLGRLNTGGKKWRGSDVLVFRTNLRLISKPALYTYARSLALFYFILWFTKIQH